MLDGSKKWVLRYHEKYRLYFFHHFYFRRALVIVNVFGISDSDSCVNGGWYGQQIQRTWIRKPCPRIRRDENYIPAHVIKRAIPWVYITGVLRGRGCHSCAAVLTSTIVLSNSARRVFWSPDQPALLSSHAANKIQKRLRGSGLTSYA